MASTHLISLSLVLLLIVFPSTEADDYVPTEKKTDVVVEAMVYCQSCDHYGTWSLTGARPIAAAKVSVTCKNHKGQVSYYKVFETNRNGYLFAQLEGFKVQNYLLDHPLQSCFVKLVWSSVESCSLLSNVNYALDGAPLRYENKRLHGSRYEAVVYAAGPLAFRPNGCSHTTQF
ncbi:non-classical arabinogalactan protein 30 [Prosopis cineraria]|uniref:non-classical arabinogalactan protein 30 n=1 Tax=Prosopis cineraria TaxID=364024 RepID=UPI00241004B2|nr:non-classical arabinogalactan protein 30 [Prosopis cineraria]